MNKRLLLTLVLMLAINPAALAESAGAVTFARGDVNAERQPPVALAKGDSIEVSDEIVTGDAARAQFELLDGARIAMRPNSRLRIDEFSYTPPESAAVTSSDDSSVISLIKGGFRTITGAVGNENEADYEVRTAVGVLGIRGTDYTAVFCNGDCDWVPGAGPGSPIADGLYLGVTEGTIVFRTPTRTIEVNAGEYAFIPLNSSEPQRLDFAPGVLLIQDDLRFEAGSDSGRDPGKPAGDDTTLGFDENLGTRRGPDSSAPQGGDEPAGEKSGRDQSDTPSQPTIVIDPNGNPVDITPGTTPPDPTGPRTIAYSSGPNGVLDFPQTGVQDNDPTQVVRDAADNPEQFDLPVAGRTGGTDTVTVAIGTAANTDTGSDSMTVLRWGRWTGGIMDSTLVSDGSSGQIDLSQQSLHWIEGPDAAPPVIPITGVAIYTLVGNTQPTDNLGNVGTLGSASFQADFVNMLVDSTLTIDIAGSNWVATGNGSIGAQANLPAHLFSGFYNVSVDGIGGGAGTFSGFFSQPGPSSDPTFPGGAGLTYALGDAAGSSTVTGAVAFGNP